MSLRTMNRAFRFKIIKGWNFHALPTMKFHDTVIFHNQCTCNITRWQQRYRHAPCSDIVMHHAAISSCTMQRYRHAPCSDIVTHHAAISSCTMQRYRHAPCSDIVMHHAAISSCTMQLPESNIYIGLRHIAGQCGSSVYCANRKVICLM